MEIGDGGDGKQFGRRQFWRTGVPRVLVQRANGAGVARLGAQLPAARDVDEFIGARAQFVANVGKEIVAIAVVDLHFNMRLTCC